MKNKANIFINPLSNIEKPPVQLTNLSEVLDHISSRFDIISIDIQLNENNRPSEFYFDLLSGLCKSVSNKVKVDNYIGKIKPNIFRIDSFDTLNITISNNPEYSFSFNNSQKTFADINSFLASISQY